MAVQLSEELVTLYRDVFQRFDKEGCGTISKSGLEKVMRTLGQDTSEEKLKELIKQYDKHGNGYITYEDFMARMSERSNPDDVTEEDIREVFDVFDTEGNGSIGIDNFWETMIMLGYGITKEEAVDIFKAGDEDEDGRVNFDDFTRMLQRENVL